jgi:hypothetical protein
VTSLYVFQLQACANFSSSLRVLHVPDSKHGEMRNAYKILVGKPEGKRPLGRPSSRWEDNIMNLRGIEWVGVAWIHLVQDKDQWLGHLTTVMNPRVP